MSHVSRGLPSGTVTFLFTDVEGSTKLLHEVGAEQYAAALAGHRRVLREAFAAHGGVEVDTQGDAFFVAYPTPSGALAAAAESQRALSEGPIQVRIGIHTGTPHLTEEGYVGADVHKAARIAAAGHGGQVLLSKATRDLVDDDVSDLGEHRLKDFADPVWIFQLGKARFPPLRTISNTNLPRPASPFVGREQAIVEVVSLLQDDARLLTLTGPGGSGKTRLAIEAAIELVPEFKAGVFWVGLATLKDPALLSETIAQTLGAKDGLAEHIGERELLLLLDNLEQVIKAAPELASLVESCPNLRLLVTSRELLRVRGEVEYPVLPLADPEASELFCTRARLEPDETIRELCRALDNLPLALELAAARTSVFSPRQILERLGQRLDLLKGGRDADPRQQTLRATIDWSHELLDHDEQRLFARLAVFRGGCTFETAETVCDADADTLQSLVDKSLLRHTEERFWMLETIREFASERLERSGEAEQLFRRHAERFVSLAEEARPQLTARPKEWLDQLDREHDNLRAALDRLEAFGETQLALRLAGALRLFWLMRGYFSEGARRVENLLRADARPTAARATVLATAGWLAVEGIGDLATARRRAEESLALHRSLGDARGIADSLFLLADTSNEEGDIVTAQRLFAESARHFRDLGDHSATLFATSALAWTYDTLGDKERAHALYEDVLRQARATGNARSEGRALCFLAWHAIEEGRSEDALTLLEQAYAIHRNLGDRQEIALDVLRFAAAVAVGGRGAAAAQLVSCSETLREEIGLRGTATDRMNENTLSSIRAQLDEAAFAEAWEQGRTLTADEAAALALDPR
jgi:predicted ATPase/class 3 adenylate cyclase